MDNFTLFVCGVIVTLITGMGVITSEVFLGYSKFMKEKMPKIEVEEEEDDIIESIV